MKDKIKIFFVLPTLFAGGAERVISFISQNLDKKKFEVSLIVIGFEKDTTYVVKDVRVIYLNKHRVLKGTFSIIKILKNERPDIVLSSISHLNIMMGLISVLFKKMKFIGRHATITKVANKYRAEKRTKFILTNLFDYSIYGIKKLDAIICQSQDMKKDFLEVHDVDKNKITIIHNPITEAKIVKKSYHCDNEIKKIITVGRMSKIKGQLRLLEILNKFKFPFKFTMIGSGPYKEMILNKIKELNLEEKVTIVAHTENVSSYLAKNDIFIQGSYSEGFPNALLESCVVGTPVIAFDVPGGTKEIIENGVNGFLVNTEDEFLEKLKENRTWDPETVRNSVLKKFNKEKIIGEYEQLFLDVLKK